jgi:hypothetical protein
MPFADRQTPGPAPPARTDMPRPASAFDRRRPSRRYRRRRRRARRPASVRCPARLAPTPVRRRCRRRRSSQSRKATARQSLTAALGGTRARASTTARWLPLVPGRPEKKHAARARLAPGRPPLEKALERFWHARRDRCRRPTEPGDERPVASSAGQQCASSVAARRCLGPVTRGGLSPRPAGERPNDRRQCAKSTIRG